METGYSNGTEEEHFEGSIATLLARAESLERELGELMVLSRRYTETIPEEVPILYDRKAIALEFYSTVMRARDIAIGLVSTVQEMKQNYQP